MAYEMILEPHKPCSLQHFLLMSKMKPLLLGTYQSMHIWFTYVLEIVKFS